MTRANSKYSLFTIFIILVLLPLNAQNFGEQKNHAFSGYFSFLPYSIYDGLTKEWNNNVMLHNRLNFYYYPFNNWNFSVQLRNRLVYGEILKQGNNYAEILGKDNGYLDMTTNIVRDKYFVFNMNVDRLWMQYTKNNLDITIGRQRINWGQSLVWNPNDIFNNFNYFDFDYVEKPGSDAIRIQYYTGMVSSIEMAAKIDSDNDITAAALYRFNKWNYDFQFIGGLLNEDDIAVGYGWSGSIRDIGFRGEISYFHPVKKELRDDKVLISTISLDYTFPNSLYILSEICYNKQEKEKTIFDFEKYFEESLNVKNLSFSELSVLGQVNYPLTPLLNIGFSGMVFQDITGFYLGPNIEYSLGNNMSSSLHMQYFKIKTEIPGNQFPKNYLLLYLYLRLKYSF